MDKEQQSDLLHNVVADAEKEQFDEQHPHQIPQTQEQLVQERNEQAEQIDTEVMDLEEMKFSSKDLKGFTGLTQKHQESTMGSGAQQEAKSSEKVEEKKASKNFYEQLYDQKK